MESPNEIMRQVQDTMKFAGEKDPMAQKAFMDFNQAVLAQGSLSTKVKELIAVALSLSSNCEWCITYHVKAAKDLGATDEEIMEASYVAVLLSGAPALMHVAILKKALTAK